MKQGAPADALVTADTKTMDGLKAETNDATVIAKNRLVIAVGKGNPFKIDELKDLADTKLKVVLAAPEVPVGRYGKQILDAQKIEVKPVSQEPNVRAVLSKVELGEADAGLVYKTDSAKSGDKVVTVDIPDDQNAVASYPAATLKQSKNSEAAAAFVAWLSTPEAQKILQDAGLPEGVTAVREGAARSGGRAAPSSRPAREPVRALPRAPAHRLRTSSRFYQEPP